MTVEKKVPKATLQRYPVYLKALRRLKAEGVTRVMSKTLADYVSIESTTIRRDFSFLGNLGKQGYGYDVNDLIQIFSDQLGVNFDEKIILIGAGNLGKALLNYNNWNHVVGEIVCAFDIEPEKITGASVPVYGLNELPEKIPSGCRIALLCIVSFAVDHFSVPPGVYVKQVDVVSSIQELVFETNALHQ